MRLIKLGNTTYPINSIVSIKLVRREDLAHYIAPPIDPIDSDQEDEAQNPIIDREIYDVSIRLRVGGNDEFLLIHCWVEDAGSTLPRAVIVAENPAADNFSKIRHFDPAQSLPGQMHVLADPFEVNEFICGIIADDDIPVLNLEEMLTKKFEEPDLEDEND